jgi:hypothetical protein
MHILPDMMEAAAFGDIGKFQEVVVVHGNIEILGCPVHEELQVVEKNVSPL